MRDRKRRRFGLASAGSCVKSIGKTPPLQHNSILSTFIASNTENRSQLDKYRVKTPDIMGYR
jgi:hypothetical protein